RSLARCAHFDRRLAVAVENKAVRMRLAAKTQSAPFRLMRRDSDRGYLRIEVEIFLCQHLTEIFRAESGIFAGDDIDDILDGIGRYRRGVVCIRIGAGEITLDHRLDV